MTVPNIPEGNSHLGWGPWDGETLLSKDPVNLVDSCLRQRREENTNLRFLGVGWCCVN